MPSVSLTTGSVYYSERGQGLPLLLLHASPGDSQDFEAVIPALSQDYRVLALDWPGYGAAFLGERRHAERNGIRRCGRRVNHRLIKS